MIIGKFAFFHKIYVRYLKRIFPEIKDNNDLIEAENSSYINNEFDLTTGNFSQKVMPENDMRNLMVYQFFHEKKGRNPFLRPDANSEDYWATSDKDLDMDLFFTFKELSIEDKVDILYFFTKYTFN